MLIQKASKFRLEPTKRQTEQMAQFAGCARYVWNCALALQKESIRATGKRKSFAELCKILTEWRNDAERPWLKESDPACFQIKEETIRLPKIGWVEFRKSKEIDGTPKNITVSKRGTHWFVSIQVELEVLQPAHGSVSMIGVDMGICQFATLSDGTTLAPLNSFRKLESKLAKAQQELARKEKFSNNWKKQKAKVTRVHIKIADSRQDFLHKTSTNLSKNHAVIVLEDLKVANLSKSAKGTQEAPGRNVRAKSGLNKSILDQGWHEFRRQLEYKQAWSGGIVILVSPRNTSRKCSACDYIHEDNRRTQASFLCLRCGHGENADVNAAKNILAAGLAVSACGDIRQIVA